MSRPRCTHPSVCMSSSAMSASSGPEEWDWSRCHPAYGTERYVQALQLLGLDLAKAVPKKIQQEAITSLDVEPLSDVIVGQFPKTPTKERLVNPS